MAWLEGRGEYILQVVINNRHNKTFPRLLLAPKIVLKELYLRFFFSLSEIKSKWLFLAKTKTQILKMHFIIDSQPLGHIPVLGLKKDPSKPPKFLVWKT